MARLYTLRSRPDTVEIGAALDAVVTLGAVRTRHLESYLLRHGGQTVIAEAKGTR